MESGFIALELDFFLNAVSFQYVAYAEGLIRAYNIHTYAVHYTLQREYMWRISRFSFIFSSFSLVVS